jgi:hypothetical protein
MNRPTVCFGGQLWHHSKAEISLLRPSIAVFEGSAGRFIRFPSMGNCLLIDCQATYTDNRAIHSYFGNLNSRNEIRFGWRFHSLRIFGLKISKCAAPLFFLTVSFSLREQAKQQ